MISPLAILVIGIVTVLALIIVLRVHAFLALITAAIVVSLLAPGDAVDKIGRVAAAFGSTAGKIGVVIAMSAIIGRCLIDSGAADRIVRAFVRTLGEDLCPVALMSSGFGVEELEIDYSSRTDTCSSGRSISPQAGPPR